MPQNTPVPHNTPMPQNTSTLPSTTIREDSGDDYLGWLAKVADTDVQGLKKAQASYGNSWKSRGGVGAYMMLARKMDRMENRVKRTITGEERDVSSYDIFGHVIADTRAEGVIDDIRDLRRYLLLVEAELLARGHQLGVARDNKPDFVPPQSNGIHGTNGT